MRAFTPKWRFGSAPRHMPADIFGNGLWRVFQNRAPQCRRQRQCQTSPAFGPVSRFSTIIRSKMPCAASFGVASGAAYNVDFPAVGR